MQETFRRVGVTVESLLTVYDNLVQANVSNREGKDHMFVTYCSHPSTHCNTVRTCQLYTYMEVYEVFTVA